MFNLNIFFCLYKKICLYLYKFKNNKMTKKVAVHICSECIKEFTSKEIYSALKPNALLPHYTVYCEKCIKELNIEEYTPYLKSRVSKSNDTETDKSKNTRKNTAKTKTATSAKTKKTTATKTKTTSTRSKK